MTELRIQIARDLTEIERMFGDLRRQAYAQAGSPDIPGGVAMVMLGPGADVEAWNYVQMSAMIGRLHLDPIETARIVNDDIEPPLSFLASWADIVREARSRQPSARRVKITSEVAYLRSALDWMLSTNDDGEPWFIQVESFADELADVRRAMESVLHDGERAHRINARCRFCDESPRLCLRYGAARDGSQDHWYCPDCKHAYDVAGVARCWRAMLVKRGQPPMWLTIKAAAAATGRSPSTIRDWTRTTIDLGYGLGYDTDPRVQSRRAGDDQPIMVLWVDVRAADDTTRRRGSYRQSA